jgi:hypothetical protein
MKAKILLPILILLIVSLGSCNKNAHVQEVKSEDTTSIKLHFSQNLEIKDPRVIKAIDEYIRRVEKNGPRVFLYQLIIGRYNEGYANITLSLIRTKVDLDVTSPVGYFKYKGRTFFIYSAISDYCIKDSSILKIPNFNLKDHIYNYDPEKYDSIPEGHPLRGAWDYPQRILKLNKDTLINKFGISPITRYGNILKGNEWYE